jgi:hypothetical protein
MVRWWRNGFAIGLLLLAASLLRAAPGTVQTDGNSTFNGDVTEDGKYVTVVSRGISIKIDRRNVAKVTYVTSVETEFNNRFSKLAADDVKGRIDLAKWAGDFDRPDLAVTVLSDAVKIDPTNHDAATALADAQKQLDKTKHATTTASSQPATDQTKSGKPRVHRLLSNDEINQIRQTEMSADDSKLRVQFQNGVVKQFLDGAAMDAGAFRNLTPAQQAQQIISSDPKLASDVRIMSDPAPLLEFRNRVYPIVASSCGSIACHGGGHAGDFALFPGLSTNAVYTNFYILQNYSHVADGVEYFMIDRTLPDRSLLLQYSLPPDQADVGHPDVAQFRARLHGKTDPVFVQWHDWIANSLKPFTPDYGLPVAWKIATSQPVTRP